ncbi:adhesion G protein-coupled receptor E3 [Nematostella vectensis]|uniref:adhesion G protein-coupled receptor E3 n=1 Tax=Nematostella vectensis TaxID=45351 RepID=UPI0020772306|nr:adhesion G protein-coupled receptor E3 [Nematostella vectensis]
MALLPKILLACSILEFARKASGSDPEFSTITNLETWAEANLSCQQKGGNLAVLDSGGKISRARALARSSQGPLWIGLSCDVNQQLSWVTGGSVHWLLVNSRATPPACYTLNTGFYKFQRQDCNGTFGYICEGLSNIAGNISITRSTQTTAQTMTSSSLNANSQVTKTLPSPQSTSGDHPSTPALFEHVTTLRTHVQTATLAVTPTASVTVKASRTIISSAGILGAFKERISQLSVEDRNSMQQVSKAYEGMVDELASLQQVMGTSSRMAIVEDIESFALEYAEHHIDGENNRLMINNKNIGIEMIIVDPTNSSTSDITLPSEHTDIHDVQITLPSSVIGSQEKRIVTIIYKDDLVSSSETNTDNGERKLNTRILSCSILPRVTPPFTDHVRLVFPHLKKTQDTSSSDCVFWKTSKNLDQVGAWSEEGCRVVTSSATQTICACDHLTNFAVLMQMTPEKVLEEHELGLAVVSYVGLFLSLFGELSTIITYLTFLNRQLEKTQIRVNLVANLAMAQIILMSGINATKNRIVCVAVAALIHYFYLAAFCWMLIEGVYLYRLVVKVFQTNMKMKYAYCFCYGFPALVVVGSLFAAAFGTGGISTYVNEHFCWLAHANHLIWTFVGPVVAITTANLVILITVIREMSNLKSVKTINSINMSSIRTSARACMILLPLFGVTWLFGLLSLGNVGGVAGRYVFTILNSLQGFMIFVFHCVRSTELRAAVHLKLFKWESSNSRTPDSNSTPLKKRQSSKTMAAPNKVIPGARMQGRIHSTAHS